MKKLKVLKLNDVVNCNGHLYSEQLNCVLGDKNHISETNYFWTDSNYLVDIDNDVDETLPNIRNAIELGATIETMYFVADEDFSHHVYEFDEEYKFTGFWEGVEYGMEHGIIFALESDAVKYQKFVDLVSSRDYRYDTISGYRYNTISKEAAIKIIENTPIEEIARRLLKKQKYQKNGAVCYLDLETGIVRVSEECELYETEILLAFLSKDYNRVDKREDYYLQNIEMNIEEYDALKLASFIELEDYKTALDKFYGEEDF